MGTLLFAPRGRVFFYSIGVFKIFVVLTNIQVFEVNVISRKSRCRMSYLPMYSVFLECFYSLSKTVTIISRLRFDPLLENEDSDPKVRQETYTTCNIVFGVDVFFLLKGLDAHTQTEWPFQNLYTLLKFQIKPSQRTDQNLPHWCCYRQRRMTVFPPPTVNDWGFSLVPVPGSAGA